jgi:hypothetical protein
MGSEARKAKPCLFCKGAGCWRCREAAKPADLLRARARASLTVAATLAEIRSVLTSILLDESQAAPGRVQAARALADLGADDEGEPGRPEPSWRE